MPIGAISLTGVTEGVDDATDVTLLLRENENRLVRFEKNDPMFEPHVPKAALASVAITLGGREGGEGVVDAAAGVGGEAGVLGFEVMLAVVGVDSPDVFA